MYWDAEATVRENAVGYNAGGTTPSNANGLFTAQNERAVELRRLGLQPERRIGDAGRRASSVSRWQLEPQP